ncbi:four helix bundle protein [Robertkochia sp. 1368]|nr:four helix bundle protein [Robertkochia sediminum]MBL7471764.1 four helix bundle protein [Robertkochia sediminum]
MTTHKDLRVWKSSKELVSIVYMHTKDFPQHEQYALQSQIRRSVISIPSNIAEGSARKGNKELCRFLYISLGSLAELDTQLEIAADLGYAEYSEHLTSRITSIRRMLINLIKAVQ